jgi:hypothetical protein
LCEDNIIQNAGGINVGSEPWWLIGTFDLHGVVVRNNQIRYGLAPAESIQGAAEDDLCLEPYPTNEHEVKFSECNDDDRQKFQRVPVGNPNGPFTVHLVSDPKSCLDVYPDNQVLNLRACHYGANQQFLTDRNGRWTSVVGGLCIDYGNGHPFANKCFGGLRTQRFQFEPVGGSGEEGRYVSCLKLLGTRVRSVRATNNVFVNTDAGLQLQCGGSPLPSCLCDYETGERFEYPPPLPPGPQPPPVPASLSRPLFPEWPPPHSPHAPPERPAGPPPLTANAPPSLISISPPPEAPPSIQTEATKQTIREAPLTVRAQPPSVSPNLQTTRLSPIMSSVSPVPPQISGPVPKRWAAITWFAAWLGIATVIHAGLRRPPGRFFPFAAWWAASRSINVRLQQVCSGDEVGRDDDEDGPRTPEGQRTNSRLQSPTKGNSSKKGKSPRKDTDPQNYEEVSSLVTELATC